MIVLVDMDGPLCSLESAVAQQVMARGFDPVPFDDFRFFHAAENYRERYGPRAAATVVEIIDTPGFYRTLPAVDGVRRGLALLEEAGHQVLICTAPRRQNPTCASDKLAWVASHLGVEWVGRTVICKDKTAVRGDLLIDDRPGVTGAFEPMWRQVLWDAPYNRDVGDGGLRLHGWADLPRLLAELR